MPESWARVSDHAALLQLVPDLSDRDIFICGPNAWMDAVVTACRLARVPEGQLHLERFSW